jgi:cytochrome c-type biogenesis protein CcmH/NrfF
MKAPTAGATRLASIIALTVTLAIAAMLPAATPAAAAAAIQPRASLTEIENDVMCVVCNTPLAVSQSPQADAERRYISDLIAKGYTKPQIERALVAQYGPAVLALPPAHGFNLTVYVLPPAILILGAVGLAFVLPRWRRRTRARQASAGADVGKAALDPTDARRLEEDLARHGP